MAILKRSKKSILGLEFHLNNLETNITNNATNISNEINRATNIENSLSSNITSLTSSINILNGDSTVNGSVEKKIMDAINPLANNDDVYSKSEINNLLSTKVDTSLVLSTISTGNKVVTETELDLKANAADVYTKTQLDTALSGKADTNKTYTKTEVDTALAAKANASDVYTKTATDELIAPKANSSDVYTKSDVDTALTTKLNTTDTVSTVSNTNKIITQTEFATKANVSDVYTKSEIDTLQASNLVDSDTLSTVTETNKVVTETELDLKANAADVYTKTQLDTALSGKADSGVAGKIGPSLKVVDETNIDDGKVLAYNATSGKLEYVTAADPSASSIDDTITSLDKTWSSTKINNELNTKANASDVYTQSEIDEKVVASAFGIKYSVADTTALNNLTGMKKDELAVNNDDRKVYKYDGTNWVEFYALDAVHNHDDRYYTKTEINNSLTTKADASDVYTKSEIDTSLASKANSSDIGKIGPSLKEIDETNIDNGKVLSYNSTTGKLEYVEQTADSLIDDNNSSTNTTYSSTKIDTELNTKADASNTYTKSEVDSAVNAKVNVSDVKSAISSSNKVVTEAEISGKADASNTYTKSEVDSAVNAKVNVSDVKSAISSTNKVVTEAEISGKADASNTYTKSEVDSVVATKANASDVYTKSEVDTSLADKLNNSDTVTSVSDSNKIITQNELSTKANVSDVYTKSEVDDLVLPKFDNSVALSTVSASNKIVTETELATKVNVSDVKGTISSGNKVTTESDVSAAIEVVKTELQNNAPIVVVDRPTMNTKSHSGLDYIFSFPLSRTPHGLVPVNDEILIYNFQENGDSIDFENVSLFEDKHGEIAVTLSDSSEEDKYNGKTIKVCYLTIEVVIAPGTDAEHPILIETGIEFEDQDATTVYSIDFSAGNFYKITFSDGYYVTVVHDLDHVDFHANNGTDYEANNFLSDGTRKSTNWPGEDADEVEYITYNWFMDLSLDSGSVYKLTFTRGDAVGGGAL